MRLKMMNKSLTLITLILISCALSGVNVSNWQNIRCSGKTSANQVFVRTECSVGTAAENSLLYYNGSSITQQAFSVQNAPTSTMQSQYTAVGTNYDYGLAANVTGSPRVIAPVYYPGTTMPALSRFTPASTDPANDQATNYLDITGDYFTFSGTKFYAAIQNRGGGFPTSGSYGTQYFTYMVVIGNPADQDTVWALGYANIPLVGITPGLYRVTGTTISDITRIGNIEYSVVSASNALLMSCNIADLLADPRFAAWYNVNNPVIGTESLTGSIAILSMTSTQTDASSGCGVYPKRLTNPLNPAVLPSLTGFSFDLDQGNIHFTCIYSDAQGRFPLAIYAGFQPGQTFPLYPQSFDHSQPVIYRSGDITALLTEHSNEPCRAAASLDYINYGYSAIELYSYILGLRMPTNVQLQGNGPTADLTWDPVDHTLLGNPVDPDLYIVEFASEATFSAPQFLGYAYDTFYTIDMPAERQFYRVRAVKYLP
jgi:hypothetical protein